MTYRFGPFVADRTSYRVLQDERVLELTPKLLDLLFYFLERPATLITKEALLEALWPGANVTDNALAQAISELRDALGDEPSSPSYILTVARRGYRFVSRVEATETVSPASTSEPAPQAVAAGFAAAAPPSIAVLDFTNVTGDAEVAWLSAGIAETVTSDLAALDHFRVVDRWRVVQAARRATGSVRDIGATLGVTLLVSGSYQRSGPTLRVTARVIDLATGEAVADAKVDGPLRDVFALQDGIVTIFARALGVPLTPAVERLGVRETSSLDAYRAYTEGWLKIESLDTTLVRQSIADFERAIELDPRYAIAYTGLANAEFVAYEITRLTTAPDRRALSSGIEHARRALGLDERLAEAHSTLSFLLTSAGQFGDARAAAQRAVALEPDSWRHHYRLGHASWGDARLRALEHALALYPQFAYAPFEMAMVHVARGRPDEAEDIVRRGVLEQDRQRGASDRFPAIGFHWLLGVLRCARGDDRGARLEFECELAQSDDRRMYGPEYAAATLVARGQLELAANAPERAIASFQEALAHIEGFVRATIGMDAAYRRLGNEGAMREARAQTQHGIEVLGATDRFHEACLMSACDAAGRDDQAAALSWLERLLDAGPPSVAGWTMPVEPFLRPLQGDPGFSRLLTKLYDRAR